MVKRCLRNKASLQAYTQSETVLEGCLCSPMAAGICSVKARLKTACVYPWPQVHVQLEPGLKLPE